MNREFLLILIGLFIGFGVGLYLSPLLLDRR